MTVRAALPGGRRLLFALAILMVSDGCSALASSRLPATLSRLREDAIARARVWTPTHVSRMDVWTGPRGTGSFAPEARVECRYIQRDMNGNTPKFSCALPNGDVVKVKYGAENGEVYAEVAATRLLWALGFGADHMYPVRVRCHGCPDTPGGPPRPEIVREFAAAIERKMPGHELEESGTSGWAWPELDAVDPARGGASVAERDALKLLAVMLQHTDSKREQQRLICQGWNGDACRRPFMLISDLGKTFGKANAFNRDRSGSVNLKAWSESVIWADPTGCRAHLGRSLTGTLDNPVISDEGRRFLADLLRQLTDLQLHGLFAVARFPLREQVVGVPEADVDAWVGVFKDKVAQITGRSCAGTRTPS